jgi:Flp pilus assembly CpaF family ATPase
VTTDLRIERLRLDLGDFSTDPERLRRLAERVAALLARRVDERAPQGAGAHRAGDLHVHVGGPGAKPHADEHDDERVAGTIADAVADALLGRLL